MPPRGRADVSCVVVQQQKQNFAYQRRNTRDAQAKHLVFPTLIIRGEVMKRRLGALVSEVHSHLALQPAELRLNADLEQLVLVQNRIIGNRRDSKPLTRRLATAAAQTCSKQARGSGRGGEGSTANARWRRGRLSSWEPGTLPARSRGSKAAPGGAGRLVTEEMLQLPELLRCLVVPGEK